jgi:hypothetical protein
MFSTPAPNHFRPELAALIFAQANEDDIPPDDPEETGLSEEDLGNVSGGRGPSGQESVSTPPPS